MLAVIDYGAGNLRSVLHALDYLGARNRRIVQAPADLRDATKVILPGVGAFGAGMNQLRAQGMIEPIREIINSGIPYLGICLGMQFLFDSSDEMGDHAGLGVLKGRVTRFSLPREFKVPHMGWNQITGVTVSPLLSGLETNAYAYFVHSYYCVPDDPADVLLTATYGSPFAAGIARDNIYGVQFHPEKSQRTGLRILRNFLEMAA